MIEVLKPLIRQFMPFAQEKMGFSRPPRLFLRKDEQNAANPMGKTGFYDPQNESITLYITGRHPKDIMRSLAHELQHHTQKCNGEFEKVQNMGEEGYAQNDPHMRNMEIEAYQASIVFRDWEDSQKGTIYYEHLQKGDKSSMSTKKWKNGELKSLLSEAWGFKMDLSKLNESKEETLKEMDMQTIYNDCVKACKASYQDTQNPCVTKCMEQGGPMMAPMEEQELYEYSKEKESEERTGSGDGTGSHDTPGSTQTPKEYIEGDPKAKSKSELKEDSGEEEKRHYEDDDWHDKDRIEAIRRHLDALERDKDYDHDHESLEEVRRPDTDRIRKVVRKVLKELNKGK